MARLNNKFATVAMMGVSAALALAGCSSSNDADGSNPPSASGSTAEPSRETSSGSRNYADGEYEADGEYGTQDSSIGVSLTLDDGTISQVDVEPHATNQTSLGYQERFAEAVPDLVEGKSIDTVQLDRVAGSSGTPDGFNDALEKIKGEAAQ